MSGHTVQLNNMYNGKKSQEYSNQVPTRNQSAHINTAQQELVSQQGSYLHITWRNYISFKQHFHENRTDSNLDQHIY
jgi:hypothetical protein